MASQLQQYEFNLHKDSLGKGTFGEVYKAYDKLLKKTVALKISNPTAPDTERYSISAEVHRIMDFRHQNLVTYYYVFETDGTDDLGKNIKRQVAVMEYIEGTDLRQLIEQENVSKNSTQLTEIITGVLDGLQFLHSQRLIHRDLKPSNILITEKDGRYLPKITDFGISKELDTDAGASLSGEIGTVAYMAPEQFMSSHSRIDHRIDIWSFGVILYEMFMGSPPFGRDKTKSKEEILKNILQTKIPPEIKNIPEPYRSVISKCLKTEPGERYSNAIEILEYLKHYPEDNLWNGIQKEPEEKRYDKYLKQYPDGRYAKEALRQKQILLEKEKSEQDRLYWEERLKTNTIDAFTDYIQKYPQGAKVQHARDRISQLSEEQKQKELQQKEDAERAKKIDPAISDETELILHAKEAESFKKSEKIYWEKIKNHLSPKTCKEYLKTYPGGEHSKEVKSWLRKRVFRRSFFIILFCTIPVALYFGMRIYLAEQERNIYTEAIQTGNTDANIGYLEGYPQGKYRLLVNTHLTQKYDRLIAEGIEFYRSSSESDITDSLKVSKLLESLLVFTEAKRTHPFIYFRDTMQTCTFLMDCKHKLDTLIIQYESSIAHMQKSGLSSRDYQPYQDAIHMIQNNPLYKNQ